MAQPFSTWLLDKLFEKRWKQADLVRASGGTLKSATVSKWVRGRGKPEEHDLIAALARTLRVAEEEVWRAIGETEPPRQADLFADVTPAEAIILRRLLLGLRDGLQDVHRQLGTDAAVLLASATAETNQGRAATEHPRSRLAGKRAAPG